MEDDWKRKYLVISGFAAPKARQEESVAVAKQPEPIVEAEPAPIADDVPKKTPRKRSVKKELNEAAEKPKKKPAAKKSAVAKKPRKPAASKSS